MGLELPIPTQYVVYVLPSASWAIGTLAAVAGCLLALRVLDSDPARRRRRAVAVGWSWAATLVSSFWILVGKGHDFGLADTEVLEAARLGFAVLWTVAAAAVGGYLSDLMMSTPPPRRLRRPSPPPAASLEPLAPVLGPPPGAPVAAGGGPDGGHNEGLLRALREGPDFQRPAAARALSLAYAGTADPDVARALLDTLGDADCSTAGRSEAYLALHQVFGDELEWDTEVQIRREFPEGTDPDQVQAWELRLEGRSPGDG